ncbi:PREDICTED: uncharacterized protein LOC106815695 [Priapulus caudatus]|uniref:Uncharacterized protein LOC106815695 n=1 Tax=Priapulus caudatus TaxID=37621 RepID=A0ABM1EU14_PRICU|nr:PREDICTED: uncharacterized protein LOC106815695 [Priapulus caudatus]
MDRIGLNPEQAYDAIMHGPYTWSFFHYNIVSHIVWSAIAGQSIGNEEDFDMLRSQFRDSQYGAFAYVLVDKEKCVLLRWEGPQMTAIQRKFMSTDRVILVKIAEERSQIFQKAPHRHRDHWIS